MHYVDGYKLGDSFVSMVGTSQKTKEMKVFHVIGTGDENERTKRIRLRFRVLSTTTATITTTTTTYEYAEFFSKQRDVSNKLLMWLPSSFNSAVISGTVATVGPFVYFF